MQSSHWDAGTSVIINGDKSTQSGADPAEGKAQFYGMRDTWKNLGPVPPLVEGFMTLIIGPQSETAALWQEWTPKWQARTGAAIRSITP